MLKDNQGAVRGVIGRPVKELSLAATRIAGAAQDTADSILEAVNRADEMSKLINGIADYTKQQHAEATEIHHGIEQISTVVQTNVATAEESASASEELSGQAAMLRRLVTKFRLRDSES